MADSRPRRMYSQPRPTPAGAILRSTRVTLSQNGSFGNQIPPRASDISLSNMDCQARSWMAPMAITRKMAIQSNAGDTATDAVRVTFARIQNPRQNNRFSIIEPKVRMCPVCFELLLYSNHGDTRRLLIRKAGSMLDLSIREWRSAYRSNARYREDSIGKTDRPIARGKSLWSGSRRWEPVIPDLPPEGLKLRSILRD
jgi:hypothetical protein